MSTRSKPASGAVFGGLDETDVEDALNKEDEYEEDGEEDADYNEESEEEAASEDTYSRDIGSHDHLF